MGRGDFYSDLSERNREAFTSFSMSQDRLSLFLFLSPYIHRLSLDFIASLCFYLGVRLGLEENWVLFCGKRCFGSAKTFF